MVLIEELLNEGHSNIPIYLRERRGTKRVVMSFSRKQKQIVISAPRKTSKTFLKDFIQKHTDWIKKQAAKHDEAGQILAQGATITFLNKTYTLIHEESNKVLVNLTDDCLFVRSAASRIETHVKRWFLSQAQELLTKTSLNFAQKLGVEIKKVSVKTMHARWGSCSSTGNLNYNWRLIFAPEEILRYVCAHEVSHRKHMNHSKDFWNTVGTLYPDFAAARVWLKKNGNTLYALG